VLNIPAMSDPPARDAKPQFRPPADFFARRRYRRTEDFRPARDYPLCLDPDFSQFPAECGFLFRFALTPPSRP
jgi:hypothetical protein